MRYTYLVLLLLLISSIRADDYSSDADENGNIFLNNYVSVGTERKYNIISSIGSNGGDGRNGANGNPSWHIVADKGQKGKDGLIIENTIISNSIISRAGNAGNGGNGGDGWRGHNAGQGGGESYPDVFGGDGGLGGDGGNGIINNGLIRSQGISTYGGKNAKDGNAGGRGYGGIGGKSGSAGSGIVNNSIINSDYLISESGLGGYGVYNTGNINISSITTTGNTTTASILNSNIVSSKNNDLLILNNGTGIGIQNFEGSKAGIIKAKNLILDNIQITNKGVYLVSGGKISVSENLTIKSGITSAIDDKVVFVNSKGDALDNKTLNLNSLNAIGGGKGAYGFVVGNNGVDILKIQTLNALGVNESGIYIKSGKSVFVSSINTTGGVASGIYNLGEIKANTENLDILGSGSGIGIQNLGSISGDNITLSVDKEISNNIILNTGTKAMIEAKSLIINHNASNSFLLENTAGARIQTDEIILGGGNAIRNNGGSVITSNLLISNSSNIYGGITFDSSKNSNLEFKNMNFDYWSLNPKNAFLSVSNGNITLNPNTNISIDFSMSAKQLLQSNLTYNTSYLLASGIVDNRSDKDKNIVNSFLVDGVSYIDFTAQAIALGNNLNIVFKPVLEDNYIASNPFECSFENTIRKIINSNNEATQNKVGHTAINSDQKDISRIINELDKNNKNADKIISSMIESNKFQDIAIEAGIKQALGGYDENGKRVFDYSILNNLVNQTNLTLAAAIGNSITIPLRISQYTNEQIQNRINSLLLSRFSYSIVLEDKVTDISLEQLMKSMRQTRGNTMWFNVGGSYYQGTNSNNLGLGNASFGYDRNFDINDISSVIVGGIFNYSYGQYTQNFLKEKTNAFTLGAYFQYEIKHNEIQGAISQTWMVGNGNNNVDIENNSIGIHNQSYKDNSTSFDLNLYYKYRFDVTYNQRIKPLIMLNYTFITMPRQETELFDIQEGKNNILALGVGGEYIFSTKSTSHTLQAIAKYNLVDTMNTRAIAFNGSNTYINYDLNLPSVWFRMNYTGTLNIREFLSANLSFGADVSNQLDFGVMGNIGIKWVF